MADRIVVLQNGTVIEEGTHDEIVLRGGAYAELFELQAVGYQQIKISFYHRDKLVKGKTITFWKSKKNSLFSDEHRSKLTGHSPDNNEFLRKNLRPFRATKETHAASRRGILLD